MRRKESESPVLRRVQNMMIMMRRCDNSGAARILTDAGSSSSVADSEPSDTHGIPMEPVIWTG